MAVTQRTRKIMLLRLIGCIGGFGLIVSLLWRFMRDDSPLATIIGAVGAGLLSGVMYLAIRMDRDAGRS